jgi:hypothetical protein
MTRSLPDPAPLRGPGAPLQVGGFQPSFRRFPSGDFPHLSVKPGELPDTARRTAGTG